MKIKVGFDAGASRIKIAFINPKTGEEIVKEFPHRVLLNASTSNASDGALIQIKDGKLRRVGSTEGKSSRVDRKVNYKHLEEVILYVAYIVKKELNIADTYISLELNTLLPPKQFLTNGKEYKEKIEAFGTITGRVNEIDEIQAIISKNSVKLCCEGATLLNALDIDKLLGEDVNTNKLTLIDAGSSTVDLVALEKRGGQWVVINAITLDNVGGAYMLDAISKELEKKYTGQDFPSDRLEKDMYYQLRNDSEVYKVLDVVHYADDVVESMEEELEQFHKAGLAIITGGAAELFNESKVFRKIVPNSILVPENLRTFGNAIGALRYN